MIEVINKLINILTGTPGINWILHPNGLRSSFNSFLSDFWEVSSLVSEEYSYYFPELFKNIKYFDFSLFISWLFSSPNVIISFVFYLLMAWCVFYFCLIVPYRLIKNILPKVIRGGK